MAYDPADRPPSAAALRDALAAADLTPPAHAGSGPHRPPPNGLAPTPAPTGPPAAPPRGPGGKNGNGGHTPHRASPPVPDPYGRTGDGSTAGAADANTVRRSGVSTPLLVGAIVVAVAIVTAGALVAYSIAGGSGKTRGSSAAGAGTGVGTGGGAATPKAKDPFGGVETITQNCPAATVRGANARCTKTAECWDGIVAIGGDVAINRQDCTTDHVFETFAIALLPADAQTWDQETVARHPLVRQVCSRDIMARSRFGRSLREAPNRWSIEVVPPSRAQFETQGVRIFRCVATLAEFDIITGSAFRPRK
jgi:hypothetical protein